MSAPDDCGNDCFGPNGHAEGCPEHCGCYTTDLSPAELATVARFEQTPDALTDDCDTCGDTGRVDWEPGALRDSDDDQQPCPDCSAPDALTECGCRPCPGRGNDGHGLTHCAECCFGTGVDADLDCPVHGMDPATAPDALGLREEVAEVLREFVGRWGDRVYEWHPDEAEAYRSNGGFIEGMAAAERVRTERAADALLPLIERREAEAAERALRDAVDAAKPGREERWQSYMDSAGGTTEALRQGKFEGWDAAMLWLNARADRIGGDSDA